MTWEDGHVSQVAVKVLKEGASRETRDDFKREVEIMSAFDHTNILKLLGVVAIGRWSIYCIRMIKSVKCYPGGRTIDLIPSIPKMLLQMWYHCVQYMRRHRMSIISHF